MRVCFWIVVLFFTGIPGFLSADVVTVDTTNGNAATDSDGTLTSIAALKAGKGADGKISLREALAAIGNDPSTGHVINFDTTVFSPATQAALTVSNAQLPQVSRDATIISGSDAGITVDGSGFAAGTIRALEVVASNVVVKGLHVEQFPGHMIWVNGALSNVIIGGTGVGEGNFIFHTATINHLVTGIVIGVSGTGNKLLGNYIGTNLSGENRSSVNWNSGIDAMGYLGGDVTVGGTTSSAANVIGYFTNTFSGGSKGITIHTGNINPGTVNVIGNYIGVMPDGTSIGNENGIIISGPFTGFTCNIGDGTAAGANTIAGNNRYGIDYTRAGGITTIKGNYIGTTSTWLDRGNLQGGIYVNSANSAALVVGGANSGDENWIGFNAATSGAGILVNNGETKILGNYIGTNAAGANLGNTNQGILLDTGADSASIGTDGTNIRGNTIGFSSTNGIEFKSTGGSTTVVGNYIGVSHDSAVWRNILNAGSGIKIFSTNTLSSAITVGGVTPESANIIGNQNGFLDSAILLSDGGSNIKNNYLGATPEGTNIGNNIGIWSGAGADTSLITGNVFGFNTYANLWFQQQTTASTVKQNYFGVTHDSSGWRNIAGAGDGILVNSTAGTTLALGGTVDGDKNCFGFLPKAVNVTDGDGNIRGNWIGTNEHGDNLANTRGVVLATTAGTFGFGGAASGSSDLVIANSTVANIEMAVGKLDFVGSVSADGVIDINGGIFDLNDDQLIHQGSIDATGGTFTSATGTLTLDNTQLGAAASVLTNIGTIHNLHYRGRSGVAFAPGNTTFTGRVIVEKGYLDASADTWTLNNRAYVQVGVQSGTTAVLTLDGTTFNSDNPGTTHFSVSIDAGGDLQACNNSVINSGGIRFLNGSRMGANTSLSNGMSNFQDLTFNNLSGIGIDLDSVTHDSNFPQEVDDIVFNGSGINVSASAGTPRVVFTKSGAANFGSLAADGESGDSDPSTRIAWDLTAGSVLLITGVTVDATTDVVYVTFNDELLAGRTTVADWLLLASDGMTNLTPGLTVTQLRNQVLLDPVGPTGGVVFYHFFGTNLASRAGHLQAIAKSGVDPTITDPGDQQGPPGYYTVTAVTNDGDGGPVSVDIAYVAGPISLPTLSNTPVFTLGLTADGTYVFAATVTDNVTRTLQVRFNVTIDNVAPFAAISLPTLVVTDDMVVSLDGLQSGDGNGLGDIALYQWHFRSGPSAATLTQDLAGAGHLIHPMGVATFDTSVLNSGVYDFLLQVTDDNTLRHQVAQRILIQGQNLVPLADAGIGGSRALAGGAIQLRGHESVDPEGTALSYGWAQTSGPSVTITNPSLATTSFSPNQGGVYIFSLVVTDGAALTSPADTVTWTIDDQIIGLVVPIASAGTDMIVTQDQTVTLDGSLSADHDGQPLTYQWTQTAGPAVSLDFSTLQKSRARLGLAGLYRFSLTVSNDHFESVADEMSVWCSPSNAVPYAAAGPDQSSTVGQWVTLDGSGSVDANGDMLTYHWVQTLGPAVSCDFSIVNPTFPVALSRVYGFSLQVGDGTFFSTADTVHIVVNGSNSVPSAIIGNQFGHNAERYALKQRIRLDGSASSDGDGDSLAIVNWLQTSGPPAALETPSELVTHFTPQVTGDYVFELFVDDGNDRSLADSITVSVFESTAPIPIRMSDNGGACLIVNANKNLLWFWIFIGSFAVLASASKIAQLK